jgi:hypothetical protein
VAAETLEHLFFSCPLTQKMLHKLKEKYFYEFDIHRENFFWGIVSENERENICATILFDIFRYLIWQAKLEKKIPTVSQFFYDMEYKLYTFCKSSQKINHLFNESNIILLAGDGDQRGQQDP